MRGRISSRRDGVSFAGRLRGTRPGLCFVCSSVQRRGREGREVRKEETMVPASGLLVRSSSN